MFCCEKSWDCVGGRCTYYAECSIANVTEVIKVRHMEKNKSAGGYAETAVHQPVTQHARGDRAAGAASYYCTHQYRQYWRKTGRKNTKKKNQMSRPTRQWHSDRTYVLLLLLYRTAALLLSGCCCRITSSSTLTLIGPTRIGPTDDEKGSIFGGHGGRLPRELPDRC